MTTTRVDPRPPRNAELRRHARRSTALLPEVRARTRRCPRRAAGERPRPDERRPGPSRRRGRRPRRSRLLDRYMPTPQVAAVAVMALLAAGVVLGAVTDQFAQSASAPIVLLGSPASAPRKRSRTGSRRRRSHLRIRPGSSPAGRSAAGRTAGIRRTARRTRSEPEEPFELPPEGVLPPVTHFFLIVLGDQGFEAPSARSRPRPTCRRPWPKRARC